MKENEEFDSTNIEAVAPEEKFNLLFKQDSIIPPEYTALIAKQESRDDYRFYGTEYANGWGILYGEQAEAARNFFKQRLSGHPLIDLGGGLGDPMCNLAATKLGSSVYVNVDRNPYESNVQPNPYEIEHSAVLGKNPGTFIVNVYADMLDFISKLKDGVASFVINGIDSIIVDDPKYHQALAKEIIRSTQVHGLIFGINSKVLLIMVSGKLPIKPIDLKNETGLNPPFFSNIYEKME